MARHKRPPVIAVMGHIDHGKSSLLDYIRKSNVVAAEAGGITQHVAAYVAEHAGRQVTFLDTPGHEAFKSLRARGAQAADIAILVVAADEGVMPQTLDALAAIKEAKIPFVVAITKIDKNNADIERAKTSLLEHEVFLEGLGGEIPYALISSKSGQGVPELLDLVLLAADLAELTADPTLNAAGFVLESSQDPKRGVSATLIIKDGTLKTGMYVVAGDAFAPVRFIENFLGVRVESVGPSEPALVAGFSKLPPAGTPFIIAEKKKDAEMRAKEAERKTPEMRAETADGISELPLVIKADVAGSVEAILHELKKLAHDRTAIKIISTGVGAVSESDVKTALAAGGVVIAFHVGVDQAARDLADRDHVSVHTFAIIYELSEKVASLLAERAPKVETEKELGRATVLKTFSSGSRKQVLGARYVSGIITLRDRVRVMRRGTLITSGSVTNLQLARSDVKEVKVDGDFGMEIEAKEDTAPGDEIIAFTVIQS